MNDTWLLAGGVALIVVGIAAAFLAIWGRSARLPIERRTRPGSGDPAGPLAAPAQRLVRTMERALNRAGRTAQLGAALDRAGLNTRPGDFLVMVVSGVLAAAAVGLIVSGTLAALVLALAAPLVAKMYVSFRSTRRRAAFADQLDDSLQLLAGNLRAGHSLLRAMDSVSREAEEPTSTEFSRLINETRVGRPLGDCLEDIAARMRSDDFTWVAQAIAIHREVGGDLAEVLDTVSQTIRERNQIRRQVKALSAEGRMSGYVLMALPIGVTGFLMMSNPGYLTKLTQSAIGWAMIGAAVTLMVVGGLWLRKVVSFKF